MMLLLKIVDQVQAFPHTFQFLRLEIHPIIQGGYLRRDVLQVDETGFQTVVKFLYIRTIRRNCSTERLGIAEGVKRRVFRLGNQLLDLEEIGFDGFRMCQKVNLLFQIFLFVFLQISTFQFLIDELEKILSFQAGTLGFSKFFKVPFCFPKFIYDILIFCNLRFYTCKSIHDICPKFGILKEKILMLGVDIEQTGGELFL